jgi:membrane associated rhomboid family serine protease
MGLSWITAMFLHGGWDHILGNMLFLAIFGKNVEDAFGPIRYLMFYFAGGFAAWIFPVFLVRIPAWIFLGAWFLYQLIEANFGLFNAHANGGGVAFFAHVGGFVFGLLAVRLLARAGGPRFGSTGAPRRSADDGGADRPRIRYSQY